MLLRYLAGLMSTEPRVLDYHASESGPWKRRRLLLAVIIAPALVLVIVSRVLDPGTVVIMGPRVNEQVARYQAEQARADSILYAGIGWALVTSALAGCKGYLSAPQQAR